MLSCANCDALLKLNAKLCVKCGHVVSDEEREAAVTGVPIKKLVEAPIVIQGATSIVEPINFVEEKSEVLAEIQPVVNRGLADATLLSSEPQKMIEAIVDANTIPGIKAVDQVLNLGETKVPERQLKEAPPPIPTATSTARKSDLSNKEELTLRKDPVSKVNPKQILLVVAGLLVIGIGAFIFMGGEKSGKTTVATPIPTESVSVQTSPQPATPITPEEKLSQPSTVEPPTPQPAIPPASPPVQKPKSNSQSTAAPAAIPDLNKLVKDAINK